MPALPADEALAQLRAAMTAEAAARALLRWAREIASPLAAQGASVARGLVHMRSSADGYRGLVVEAWEGAAQGVSASATIFGWIERQREPVALDLATFKGAPLRAGDRAVELPALWAGSEAASVQQIVARRATHVIALPLIAPGRELVGMLALELSWPERLGARIEPGPWLETMELACAVAAAHVRDLPREASERATVDPLLPVVGARTAPVIEVLRMFARQDETILLAGPTGSGKTRLAAWCHARSDRSDGPFETAYLLSMPEEMQMAELFGWKRGAFTGATGDHDGVVTDAEGGTLFIDEVDKFSLKAQAGLLRLLETRRYTPLGGARDRVANVRFIVGTNADLRALVAKGEFREDLFYRIHVLPVRLPPLDERRDEIPRWATFFCERRHREGGSAERVELTEAAAELLGRASWPGNLRQLDNVVRRAYALRLSRGPAASIRIDERDVARALEFEGATAAGESAGGSDALEALARSIVDAAIRRGRSGKPVSLEALEGLPGAVLREAATRLQSIKAAYLLFGGTSLVEGRNHSKSYKRELARLEALRALLDDPDER